MLLTSKRDSKTSVLRPWAPKRATASVLESKTFAVAPFSCSLVAYLTNAGFSRLTGEAILPFATAIAQQC